MIDTNKVTIMDAFDIVEKSGVEGDRFSEVLKSHAPERARLLYAFAWVIARRVEPGLTWEEMLTYNLTLIGSLPTEAETELEAKKTRAVMNVVKMTGVSPEVARQMSVAEVAELAPKRRRRRAAG